MPGSRLSVAHARPSPSHIAVLPEKNRCLKSLTFYLVVQQIFTVFFLFVCDSNVMQYERTLKVFRKQS